MTERRGGKTAFCGFWFVVSGFWLPAGVSEAVFASLTGVFYFFYSAELALHVVKEKWLTESGLI